MVSVFRLVKEKPIVAGWLVFMSTTVPLPVRPTTEPDDSPHSLADVQRRQQAVCSQTTDEPDDGYETDIATDVVAPCCCLVQTDVFRSPDCPSIVDRTEAPFSFSGCPFCTFVDSMPYHSEAR